MVSRRHQSSLNSDAPVRFYKVVALSFLFLTVALLGVVAFMSSKRATITITTKADPLDVTYDLVVDAQKGLPDYGALVVTTTVSVSQNFNPTGSKEDQGVAEGTVTLFNKTDAAQVLIPTTRLLTPKGILFRLKDRVSIPANGSAEAFVYADQKGALGNIATSTFTIPGLPESKQKVIYAESVAAMSGGVRSIGVLSDDDVNKAKKVILALLQEKAQKSLASLHTDKKSAFFVVSSTADLSGDVKVGDTVSGFSMSGTAVVVGLFYDEGKIKTAAATMLATHAVEDVDIVEPSKDAPTVTFGSYDSNKNTLSVKVSYSGRTILNTESRQIEKSMLYGKTRDEVRRALMPLKHVQSVDVEFHPAWMMTVPHVPDHVKVEVKSVE